MIEARTDVVGSLLRPPELLEAQRRRASGELSAEELAAAEDRARKFAWEIASDFSYPVVRAGELVLTRVWQQLYDGVEVQHAHHGLFQLA